MAESFSSSIRKGDFLSQSFEWVSEASGSSYCSVLHRLHSQSQLMHQTIQKQMLKHVQRTDRPRWCHCLRPLPHRRLSCKLSIAGLQGVLLRPLRSSVDLNSTNFKPRPRPCYGLLRHRITLFEAGFAYCSYCLQGILLYIEFIFQYISL